MRRRAPAGYVLGIRKPATYHSERSEESAFPRREQQVPRSVLDDGFEGLSCELHAELVGHVAHLHAVHQRGTAADGGRHVHRLGHLLQVRTLLQAGLGVGVNAVGTLHRVGHRQGDQRLLPFRQGAFGEYRPIPLAEFVPQLACVSPDRRELGQVVRMVVGVPSTVLQQSYVAQGGCARMRSCSCPAYAERSRLGL